MKRELGVKGGGGVEGKVLCTKITFLAKEKSDDKREVQAHAREKATKK